MYPAVFRTHFHELDWAVIHLMTVLIYFNDETFSVIIIIAWYPFIHQVITWINNGQFLYWFFACKSNRISHCDHYWNYYPCTLSVSQVSTTYLSPVYLIYHLYMKSTGTQSSKDFLWLDMGSEYSHSDLYYCLYTISWVKSTGTQSSKDFLWLDMGSEYSHSDLFYCIYTISWVKSTGTQSSKDFLWLDMGSEYSHNDLFYCIYTISWVKSTGTQSSKDFLWLDMGSEYSHSDLFYCISLRPSDAYMPQ